LKRFIVLAFAALIAALALAVSASAENATLPTGNLPWSDPSHNSPLEQVASSFASRIAERPVRVQCHSEAEWAALGLPSGALGIVRFRYNVYTGVIVATEDIAHLREAVCGWTQVYGQASSKPTRCATVDTVTRTVYDTVRVKKKVWYWKKIRLRNGQTKRVRKSKYVWVTKQVPRIVTEQVPGPGIPCYGSNEALPAEYSNYSLMLEVISHEVIHLWDDRVGYRMQTQASAESRAECFGMQLLPAWALTFGGDEDDAKALAKYYWDVVYPKWGPTSPYWRPDCAPNGPLDISPNDGVWPRIAQEPVQAPSIPTSGSLAWGYYS
jgi:hypothetical protein